MLEGSTLGVRDGLESTIFLTGAMAMGKPYSPSGPQSHHRRCVPTTAWWGVLV